MDKKGLPLFTPVKYIQSLFHSLHRGLCCELLHTVFIREAQQQQQQHLGAKRKHHSREQNHRGKSCSHASCFFVYFLFHRGHPWSHPLFFNGCSKQLTFKKQTADWLTDCCRVYFCCLYQINSYPVEISTSYHCYWCQFYPPSPFKIILSPSPTPCNIKVNGEWWICFQSLVWAGLNCAPTVTIKAYVVFFLYNLPRKTMEKEMAETF